MDTRTLLFMTAGAFAGYMSVYFVYKVLQGMGVVF